MFPFLIYLRQPSIIGFLVLFSLLTIMAQGIGIAVPGLVAASGYFLSVILTWPKLSGRNQSNVCFW
jgi:ribose/xylose/arabinose/galactoside ABC-type transport system permease subunit